MFQSPIKFASKTHRILTFAVFIFLGVFVQAQTRQFRIITEDVHHFWEAIDSIGAGTDTTSVFESLVIQRASPEFSVFIKKWNIKAADYTRQLRRFPEFYRTIRSSSLGLIQMEDSIRHLVKKFGELYPEFQSADICIGFGNFYTGGNVEVTDNRNLVYIGLEYHGLDSATQLKELPVAIRDYASRSNFFRTVIHELVHIQQTIQPKKIRKVLYSNTLINRILREGIPDFISELIVPGGNQGNHYKYGLVHEDELRTKLKNELWSQTGGDWFGGNDSLFISKPRDLGYFMGSRITKSFYENYPGSKTDAIKEMITLRYVEDFLKRSKYFEL